MYALVIYSFILSMKVDFIKEKNKTNTYLTRILLLPVLLIVY